MRIQCIAIVLLSLCLSACGESKKDTAPVLTTQKVQRKALHKTLHFTGSIQPIHEYSLISPLDAVVEKMPVHFGEAVDEKKEVFTLNSSELQKQYNDALTDYLKAKDSFTMNQSKFHGAEEIWQAGLLSKNNYMSEKSSLDNARIAMLQSRKKFTELLEKMGVHSDTLMTLSLDEFDKVRTALNVRHDRIRLHAPAQGILLYAPKSGDDKSTRLSVGSSVKAGQVIALIGDLGGVRVDIDVPEIDIDKIHRGMKAHIRGVALGNEILEGEVTAINGQALPATGNSLPVFSAVVVVKQLSAAQKERIRVGMSATVELELDAYEQLMVPIAALHLEKGKSTLMVQEGTQLQSRVVRTGAASADEVAILSGLKEGEVIAFNGKASTH